MHKWLVLKITLKTFFFTSKHELREQFVYIQSMLALPNRISILYSKMLLEATNLLKVSVVASSVFASHLIDVNMNICIVYQRKIQIFSNVCIENHLI